MAQQPIRWSSKPNANNVKSNGSPMNSEFRFELGVFNDNFVPTADNVSEWSENWNSAQYTFYNSQTNSFSAVHAVTDNNPPFSAGKSTYIWGFSGTPQNAEWILLTHPSWTRPNSTNTPSPALTPWSVASATAILGEIEKSGSPFLMKSGSVSNALPPATSWETWQAYYLGSEPTGGPSDDSDHDGVANLIEFVMGSDPLKGGGAPSSKVKVVPNNSQKYLEITIPRRKDHKALITVEVSSHPAGPWFSGPGHTTIVTDSLDNLIVRDNTPLGPDNPHRFIQLKAVPVASP